MGSCSERASSLPSTSQGKTWSRHRHAVSTLRATSSGSMYLKTSRGNCTHTDSSQPETRTKTKTSRLTQTDDTARLRSGGILCHAEERCKQRYCDRGVAVP